MILRGAACMARKESGSRDKDAMKEYRNGLYTGNGLEKQDEREQGLKQCVCTARWFERDSVRRVRSCSRADRGVVGRWGGGRGGGGGG